MRPFGRLDNGSSPTLESTTARETRISRLAAVRSGITGLAMLAQTPIGEYGAWSVAPAVASALAAPLIGAATARFTLRIQPCIGAATAMSLYLGLAVPLLTWWWWGEDRAQVSDWLTLLWLTTPLPLGIAALVWRATAWPERRRLYLRVAGAIALPLVIPGVALFSAYGIAGLAPAFVFFFEAQRAPTSPL